MMDPQLKAYLDGLKKLPELPTEAALRKAFADAGWTPPEVEEAFRYLKPAPSALPPQRPPVAPQQPLVSPRPLNQAVADIRPGAPVISEPLASKPRVAWPQASPQIDQVRESAQPSSVITPLSASQAINPLMAAPTSQPRKSSKALLAIIGIIGLLVLGVGAYAFFANLGPFAKAPYDSSNLIANYITSSLDLKTASVRLDGSFQTKKRDEAVPYFEPIKPGAGTALVANVPSTVLENAVSFSTVFSGKIDYSSTTNPASSGNVALEGSFGGVAMKGDLDYVVKDRTVFVRLNSFPPIVDSRGTLAKLKGKWVRIGLDDVKELAGISTEAVTFGDYYSSNTSESQEKMKQNMRLAATLADKNKLFTLKSDPVFETINGTGAYRYDLSLNRAAIEPFIVEFLNQTSIEGLAGMGAQAEMELKDTEIQHIFDYVSQVFSTSLWVDASGKFVRRSDLVRVAPGGEETFKDLEVDLALNTTISNHNENVVIEIPTQDVMSLEDAIIAVSGLSQEEYAYQKQAAAIPALRSALALMLDSRGSYPKTLDELTTVYPVAIPKNILSYSSNGITYRLQYRVDRPPFASSTTSFFWDLKNGSSGGQRLVSLKTLSGTNTATELDESLEAKAVEKKDTDKDGLTDSLEEYIGTNKLLKDSDKDGTSDFEIILQLEEKALYGGASF